MELNGPEFQDRNDEKHVVRRKQSYFYSGGNFSKAFSLCTYFCHFFKKIFLSEPEIFDMGKRDFCGEKD